MIFYEPSLAAAWTCSPPPVWRWVYSSISALAISGTSFSRSSSSTWMRWLAGQPAPDIRSCPRDESFALSSTLIPAGWILRTSFIASFSFSRLVKSVVLYLAEALLEGGQAGLQGFDVRVAAQDVADPVGDFGRINPAARA